MSLNIKSHEADALVAELAGITGESKTQAVIVDSQLGPAAG